MPETKPGIGEATDAKKQAEEAQARYQETIDAGGSVLWKGEMITDPAQLPAVEELREYLEGSAPIPGLQPPSRLGPKSEPPARK
jgi:hypothetical protein